MMWFKVGDIAHLKSNTTIFGKKFQYNTGLKVIEINSNRESYFCEVEIKGQKRQVELSQTEFVSPKAWDRTEELNRKLAKLGLQ